ncbi:MAG: hypothetical protein LLG42_00715, partial [Chloroflexi bacterium]|nr:hypothetical protein [Chloroflexota bacterium]
MKSRLTSQIGIEKWRLVLLYGLIIFIFVYYIFQLFNLQIVQGETYLEQANENRTSEISVQTQRGSIYDRNG